MFQVIPLTVLKLISVIHGKLPVPAFVRIQSKEPIFQDMLLQMQCISHFTRDEGRDVFCFVCRQFIINI